jgi:hypothetical protein
MLKSRALHALLILFFAIFPSNPGVASGNGPANQEVSPTQDPPTTAQVDFAEAIFLPLVLHPNVIAFSSSTPRINAPSFDGEIVFQKTAIFWFGKVTPSENYTDVRIGYNASELFVHLAIFDRSTWYDKTPTPSTFNEWDSASLYLNLSGVSAYRFDGQLNAWGERDAFQASYIKTGTSWVPLAVPFTTETGWRGDAPNVETQEDRGWRITYRIPFTSLGLSAAPPEGATWNLGVSVSDRDDDIGTPIPEKSWPEELESDQPASWGQLVFGLPGDQAAAATTAESVVIRHGLGGTTVVDGTVGGGTDCGAKAVQADFFTEWGETNYAGAHQVNVQNQYDVSDWPCFSKVYFTFPLDQVPEGKTVLSATLTVYQFSNAGGGDYGIPPGSWIQVSKVKESWNEATLTWNNAPGAWENIGSTWVDWIQSPVPWPGIPRSWDVSAAVAEAYSAGEPVSLVLYSPDTAQHSGKYFTSSETGDWNETGRPTLEVTIGNP